MSLSKRQVLDRIFACGVVPVIRTKSAEALPQLAKALMAGGVPVIEVTMTTPNAIEGIRRLAREFGDELAIGVGTVVDAGTAQRAIEAGAQFVVSPTFDVETVATTLRLGAASVPGAFTPTEIVRASSAGADLVKVFPSTSLGPRYFRDLLAPLPQLKLIPTGGVDLKNVGEWIKAGAACVGVGSALFPAEALATSDWETITAHTRAFADAIKSARAR